MDLPTNIPLHLISEEDCKTRIKQLTEKLEGMMGTINCPEKERDHTAAHIAVWERIMVHVRNGQMITIDDQERVRLWSEIPKA